MTKSVADRLKLKISISRKIVDRKRRLEMKLLKLRNKHNLLKRYEAMTKLLEEYDGQLRSIETSIGCMLISNAAEDGALHI